MKKHIQKIASYIALGAVVLSGLFGFAAKTNAADPQFNFMPNDYKMLQGANRTQNDSSYVASPSGKSGETFAGLIYYHNGVLNSTAQNVRVKVSLPSSSVNGKINVQSSLMADNTETINDTMTVNLTDGDSGVEFVQGSVKWMPDANNNNNAVFPLPYNQTGNEIVGNGINLGDIQGCWEHAGFISFLFRTTTKGNLAIDKTVRNISAGDTGYADQTNAWNADEVEFKVIVSNNGGSSLTNVNIKDSLPSGLIYKNGSLSSGDKPVDENGFFSGGNTLVSLGSGESITLLFRAIVGVNQNTSLVNTAFASNSLFSVSDTAAVVVKTRVIDGKSIEIDKLVRNVSINETSFVDQNSANAGQELEYQIKIRNNGQNQIDNVIFSDRLPNKVTFVGSARLIKNGVETGLQGNIIEGITIGSLAAGETVILKFIVCIAGDVSAGTVLTNVATATGDGLVVSDSARTLIKTSVLSEEKLPKTGAETVVIPTLTTIIGGLYGVYRKKKAILDLLIKL